MSDNKPNRSVDEIQNEYARLCTRAGHMQYQLVTIQKDLDLLNGTLRDLNIEASASKAAEDSAKASEEQGAKNGQN